MSSTARRKAMPISEEPTEWRANGDEGIRSRSLICTMQGQHPA
jgi:hypothetical protein